jgi:hypothetical protein
VDREWLADEVLMLLPVLGRGLGRPGREELGEIAERGMRVDAHISLRDTRAGPYSARTRAAFYPPAGRFGRVSSPAMTQLVNYLEQHMMVQRRHDTSDRRMVLVDYAPGMEIAHRKMEGRRGGSGRP